jgi:telomeric repeat-binding factor 2-interacting protein 1
MLVNRTFDLRRVSRHSYTFVEKSVRNGRLEDLEDHRAGQRVRPVGAVGIPARSSRTPFTLQDDQILWDWVQPYERRGDQIAGNLIYQQLAEQVCYFRGASAQPS